MTFTTRIKEEISKESCNILEAEKILAAFIRYNAKVDECDAIVTGSDGWFEKQSKCLREKQELQSKMWDLESENSTIRNKDYTGYYQEVKPMSYQIFYIIGASIAGVTLLGAFIIYLVKGKKSY